jgi:hypothetical protein
MTAAVRRLFLAISRYTTASARGERSLRPRGTRRCWAGHAGDRSGEGHLRDGAVLLIGGEERQRLEVERLRDQVARERLQGDVVIAGAGVVVAAGVLELVLGGRQRLLQLQEALDRPQLRVVLRDREQGAQRPRQGVFGWSDLARVAGRFCRDGIGPGLGDRLEGSLFVGGVAGHCRDQVGDEVVAALELDVDLGERFLGPLAFLDQAIEGDPQDQSQQNDEHHNNNDDDQCNHCEDLLTAAGTTALSGSVISETTNRTAMLLLLSRELLPLRSLANTPEAGNIWSSATTSD